MSIEKMIEEEIKRNPELKAVFDADPEKKKMYEKKIADTWGASACYTEEEKNKSYKFCKTCIFAHGASVAENMPEKAHCIMYPERSGRTKPESVCIDGAECEYYEKEK